MKIRDIYEGEVVNFNDYKAKKKKLNKVEVPLPREEGEEFISFYVEKTLSKTSGKEIGTIYGIKTNGKKEHLGTSYLQLAEILCDAYNNDGYTEHKIERMKLGESKHGGPQMSVHRISAPDISIAHTGVNLVNKKQREKIETYKKFKDDLSKLATTKEKLNFILDNKQKYWKINFYTAPKNTYRKRILNLHSYDKETGAVKLKLAASSKTEYMYSYNINDFDFDTVSRNSSTSFRYFNFYPKKELVSNEKVPGIWINSRGKNKFIPLDKKQEYLDLGWKLGYRKKATKRKLPISQAISKSKRDEIEKQQNREFNKIWGKR